MRKEWDRWVLGYIVKIRFRLFARLLLRTRGRDSTVQSSTFLALSLLFLVIYWSLYPPSSLLVSHPIIAFLKKSITFFHCCSFHPASSKVIGCRSAASFSSPSERSIILNSPENTSPFSFTSFFISVAVKKLFFFLPSPIFSEIPLWSRTKWSVVFHLSFFLFKAFILFIVSSLFPPTLYQSCLLCHAQNDVK